MWRLIKVILFLAVLAAIAFVGYAYVGPVLFPSDFAAQSREVVESVDLGGN